MKHRHITTSVVAAATVFVVTAALAAQDRFSLRTPNGIAFSEFKGYDVWQLIAPSQPDDAGGCGSAPAPGCIKTILGNPTMIKAFNEGIPSNGKPVPDGAVMTKIEWQKKHKSAPPYGVTEPGPLAEVSFMMKDSKRFPGTNGWGYATFTYDAATKTFKPFGDSPSFANTCHGCHTRMKARDFVYTSFPER